MGVFPIRLARSSTLRYVSSDVAMPRMTSTSTITGTGFMKCIPMTLSARFVAAAILVMEIDDVFEARMHSGEVRRSSSAKRPVLAERFSTMASMAMSALPTSSIFVVVRMRPRISSFCAADVRPLSTPRCRFAEIVAIPRCTNSSETSTRMTESPAEAAVWAMPLPIVPAPITAIFRMQRGTVSRCSDAPRGVRFLLPGGRMATTCLMCGASIMQGILCPGCDRPRRVKMPGSEAKQAAEGGAGRQAAVAQAIDVFPKAPIVPFPVESTSPAITSIAGVLVAAGVAAIVLGSDRNVKSIRIETDLPDDLGEQLTDHDELADALAVLVDNSLNYVPSGGQVIVGVRRMEHKEKPLLLFFVMDNGPLVPEQLRQVIFEP